MTRELAIDQPFDLALSLTMGQAFRWHELPPDFYGDGHEWFSGVLGENLIHIHQTDAGVEYRVGGLDGERPADDKDDEALRRYFREDDDVAAIYADISRDPVVARLVRQYPGMRVLRQEPWECTVSYICSAQNNIPKIRQNVRAIAENWGEQVSLRRDSNYTFPGPDQLAKAEAVTLQMPKREGGLGLGKSAKYVTAIAKLVSDKGIDLKVIRVLDYHQTVGILELFEGVGPKVSNCIALMAMDKLEAFPVDRHIRRLVSSRWFGGKRTPPDDEIIQWAQDHFGHYAGYAGQFIFCDRQQAGNGTALGTLWKQMGDAVSEPQPAPARNMSRYQNRDYPCPKCGAEIGKVCLYPSGYRYEKGHSQRGHGL